MEAKIINFVKEMNFESSEQFEEFKGSTRNYVDVDDETGEEYPMIQFIQDDEFKIVDWPFGSHFTYEERQAVFRCISTEYPLYVRLFSFYLIHRYWHPISTELIGYLRVNEHPGILLWVVELLRHRGVDLNEVQSMTTCNTLLDCMDRYPELVDPALDIISRLPHIPADEECAYRLIEILENKVEANHYWGINGIIWKIVGLHLTSLCHNADLRRRIVRAKYLIIGVSIHPICYPIRLGDVLFFRIPLTAFIHMIHCHKRVPGCLLNKLPGDLLRRLHGFLF